MELLIAAVKDIGLGAVIVLASLYGIWYVLVPGILREIATVREELRADKQALMTALMSNTEAITKLTASLQLLAEELRLQGDAIAALKAENVELLHAFEREHK